MALIRNSFGLVCIASGLPACSASTAYLATPAPDCIASREVRWTRVVNSRQIDFRLRDRVNLRNTLPARCRNLHYAGTFEMVPAKPAICPGDQLVVRNRSSGPGEPGDDYCRLGPFSEIAPDVSQ